MAKDITALCYRCEHRAQFLEQGRGPRCECKTDRAVFSCYMYKPVKPITLCLADGEERSEHLPPLLAGRSQRAPEDREIPLECVADIKGRYHVRYWRIKAKERK